MVLQASLQEPPSVCLLGEGALFIFPNLLFYIGVYLINNVVVVSGGQRRDSAIEVHVSILPRTPLPSRLPHNIEQSGGISLWMRGDLLPQQQG